MVIIGIIVMIVASIMIAFFSLFAGSITHKIKIDYFRQCIIKDAAYYDEHNPTEYSAKIAKETSAIQRGTGEKVGNTVMAVMAMVFGFGFAFYWGWLMTCILLACFPVLILVGVGMSIAM